MILKLYKRLKPAPKASAWEDWWNHTMESYPITTESYLELEQGRADTVWFSKLQNDDSDRDQSTKKTGFENIADGKKVYALLRKIQDQRAKEHT